LDYDYSEDPDQAARFLTKLTSENAGYKNYTLKLLATHVISELNLDFESSMCLRPNIYSIDGAGVYKRGYLPDMEIELQCFANLKEKEIKVYVSARI
jgi:hypothetical protein